MERKAQRGAREFDGFPMTKGAFTAIEEVGTIYQILVLPLTRLFWGLREIRYIKCLNEVYWANDIHCLSPGSLNTYAHYILVSELPRKTQHHQALYGTTFYSHRKETEQSASVVGIGPPWPTGPPGSWHRASGLHSPLLYCISRTRKSRVARCHILKQNKGAHIETEQGKLFLHRW